VKRGDRFVRAVQGGLVQSGLVQSCLVQSCLVLGASVFGSRLPRPIRIHAL